MRWWALKRLSARILSENASVRASAARRLGRLSDRRAVPLLLSSLSDPDPEVQKAVGESLTGLGGLAVSPLIERLGAAVTNERILAARVLAAIGGDSVEGLISALENRANEVRQLAVQTLVEIGDLRAVEPLLRSLNDWDPVVRATVVHGLAKLWKPAVEPLTGLLKDWNHQVRSAAAQVLGQIGDRSAVPLLVHALGDKEAEVRGSAAEALSKIGGEETARYVVTALDAEDPRTREAAHHALLKMGRSAVKPLTAALRHSEPAIRASIVPLVAKTGDPSAATALSASLSDPDAGVREAAARALEEMQWHPKENVDRARLAIALQQWERVVEFGKSAVRPLIEVLADVRRKVRLAAAQVLGEIADPRAVDALIPLLSDDFTEVARAAVHALGMIGDRRAVDPLIRCLGERELCPDAVEALGRLADPRAIHPLVASTRNHGRNLTHKVMMALAQIGRESLDVLIESLDDMDRQVRRMAAEALGETGDMRCRDRLEAAAMDRDPDVRQAASIALARIDAPDVAPAEADSP